MRSNGRNVSRREHGSAASQQAPVRARGATARPARRYPAPDRNSSYRRPGTLDRRAQALGQSQRLRPRQADDPSISASFSGRVDTPAAVRSPKRSSCRHSTGIRYSTATVPDRWRPGSSAVRARLRKIWQSRARRKSGGGSNDAGRGRSRVGLAHGQVRGGRPTKGSGSRPRIRSRRSPSAGEPGVGGGLDVGCG
jgi:hypothetical protein